MGQKEAPTPHEQLENTPRFSRKTKKPTIELFFSVRRKLQLTHRADVIFL